MRNSTSKTPRYRVPKTYTRPAHWPVHPAPIGSVVFPEIPQYAIDRDGTVWSLSGWRGAPIKPMYTVVHGNGYVSVMLQTAEKRTKRYFIHDLLSRAFLPPKPAWATCVRHLDDCKLNNDLMNLAWGTNRMNAEDMVRNGHSKKGSTNPASKLTEAEVIEIRVLSANGKCIGELRQQFNVSKSLIGLIIRRKIWQHC